jgi:hypothetical protein
MRTKRYQKKEGKQSNIAKTYPSSVIGTASWPKHKLITIRSTGVNKSVDCPTAAPRDVCEWDTCVVDLELH